MTRLQGAFIPEAPPSLLTMLVPETHAPPVLPVVAVVLGLLYLWGAVRLWRRKDRWSLGRTVLFLSGCSLLLVVTGTEIDSYGTVLFSVFMFQQLTLMIAVPPLLVWGSPGRLLLRAVGHSGLGGIVQRAALVGLRSSFARYLLHPAVTIPLFLMSYYGLYLTGIASSALASTGGHLTLEIFFLVAGMLFTIPALSDDPLPTRHGHGARILDVSVEMVLHVFFGVIIMMSTTVLVDAFANPPAEWGIDPLEDQGVAGGLAWGYGEGPTVVILVVLLHRWFMDDTRRARAADARADRDGDPDLDAYNRHLADLARLAATQQGHRNKNQEPHGETDALPNKTHPI
ncbi:cytochrome c oxidase assembly protein [Microbacterium sp. A1-JK]|uniref:cytochrome c oxidase assembly protein n=1 Tax=Microbacterium sp. A1-JK TaxID=3177516 RepID=UPI003887C418